MEWQPIETAPKDGSRVILYGPKNVSAYNREEQYWGRKVKPPTVYEGYFSSGLWQIGGFGHGLPTHWMPLPEPPK